MAKLTSAQRKNLPDDVFGLPEDRAFPMPDETHVRSAITYFHTCPREKKKELANNINRMAKKYGMKVSLQKDSPFRHYADKEILDESATLVPTLKVIPDDVRKILMRVPVTEKLQDLNLQNPFNPMVVDPKVGSAINVAIRNAAKSYLDHEYLVNGGKERSTINDFVYDSDLKLCYDITRNFIYGKSVNDPEVIKKIGLVYNKDLLKNALNEVKKHVNNITVDDVIQNMAKTYSDAKGEPLMKHLDLLLQSSGEISDKKAMSIFGDYSTIKVPLHRNFSEEEIQKIVDFDEMINKLISKACYILQAKCHFPSPIWNKSILVKMYNDKVIDGYYYRDDQDYSTDRAFIKMNKCIYCVVHQWYDENTCITTAVKMFDNDAHPNYFYEIMTEFEKTNCEKLPKMPIRKITTQRHYTEPKSLTEAVKQFVVYPEIKE